MAKVKFEVGQKVRLDGEKEGTIQGFKSQKTGKRGRPAVLAEVLVDNAVQLYPIRSLMVTVVEKSGIESVPAVD
jgi:hypothetical protein